MFRMRILKVLISIGFVLWTAIAMALPTDSQERLYIVADTTVYNYKAGINTFEGHVKVDQGSTHIIADRLVTKSNAQHKIEEAIAYGNTDPAHFWTTPKPNELPLHAYAKIIRFYPLVSNVTLEQSVTVKQGDNRFQGELIHYNNLEQTITVPPTKNGRAVLVYNPEQR